MCLFASPFFSKRGRVREERGGGIHLSCIWQYPLKRQACWGLSQQDGRNLFLTLLWQQMQIAWLSPRRETESGRREKCRKRACKKSEMCTISWWQRRMKWKKNHSSLLWSLLMTTLSSALPSKYYINNCWRKIKQVKQWDGPGGCLPLPN